MSIGLFVCLFFKIIKCIGMRNQGLPLHFCTNQSHGAARLVIYRSSRKFTGPPNGPDFYLDILPIHVRHNISLFFPLNS